jgi:hypothetical protein
VARSLHYEGRTRLNNVPSLGVRSGLHYWVPDGVAACSPPAVLAEVIGFVVGDACCTTLAGAFVYCSGGCSLKCDGIVACYTVHERESGHRLQGKNSLLRGRILVSEERLGASRCSRWNSFELVFGFAQSELLGHVAPSFPKRLENQKPLIALEN